MTTIHITVDGKDDGSAVYLVWRIYRLMHDALRERGDCKLWPVYSLGTGDAHGSATATVERVDAGGGKG